MSTATATADAAPAPARGKKKLIVIVAAAVLVLALGGVGAVLMLKKQANADDEDGAEAAAPAPSSTVRDAKSAPAFVPLDPFTVNLADKQADRYAQVAITLELAEPAVGDSLKAFMPAVRNNILMVLAHKTSAELLERDGKAKLAADIQRETARAMGVDVPDAGAAADGDEDAPERKKGKKGRKDAKVALPVTAVYFSTFIIQ